jgi:hypothetical protein
MATLDGSAMRIIMASSHFYKIKGKGGTDPGGRQPQTDDFNLFLTWAAAGNPEL